jgi:hypothetical protein
LKHRPVFLLAVLLVWLTASGASCPWMLRQPGTPIPQVLPPAATLDQVMLSVNENTARVHSGATTQAQLSLPGTPPLRADLAFEMPRRFRLQAGTALTGQELDVGSNDELFWLWVKRSQPPAMFFGRHDQYAQSGARQIMPVEPSWLPEAMGLVQFRPDEQHQGPMDVGGGRLEIRSRRVSPGGDLTKITIVDAARALVLEQHLYDARGQRMASAITRDHIRDGLVGVNMPRRIELHLPASNLQMQIDVTGWRLNSLGPEQQALWVKPENPAYPNVDVADPNLQFGPAAAMPAGATPGVASPAVGMAPAELNRTPRLMARRRAIAAAGAPLGNNQ